MKLCLWDLILIRGFSGNSCCYWSLWNPNLQIHFHERVARPYQVEIAFAGLYFGWVVLRIMIMITILKFNSKCSFTSHFCQKLLKSWLLGHIATILLITPRLPFSPKQWLFFNYNYWFVVLASHFQILVHWIIEKGVHPTVIVLASCQILCSFDPIG